jgi:dihydroflavonol-4-reductase
VKLAVTGGSGVVGRAVVRHLVDAGHEVKALARSGESGRVLSALGARPVDGDVVDHRSLEDLVHGCQRVFHIAGVNEMCSLDPTRMWRVNVDGTLAVLAASREAGVERLVHTSSAVTIGEERGTLGTETSPHRGYFLSEYERSKTVSERLVFDRAEGIEVVAVNPSSVQGPGRATGTGALLLAMARGNLPFLVDTTISVVDIDDCARGHLLAADHGEPGGRYVLSGSVLSVRDGVRLMNDLMGRRSRPWFIRGGILARVAPIAGAFSVALGRQPLLCTESARVLLHGHRYDGSMATAELGLEYRSLPATLERTLAWLREEGLLD